MSRWTERGTIHRHIAIRTRSSMTGAADGFHCELLERFVRVLAERRRMRADDIDIVHRTPLSHGLRWPGPASAACRQGDECVSANAPVGGFAPRAQRETASDADTRRR